ncbi:MAG: hypothetical protein ABI480_04590 [Chitinophagaceae bacterium]
MLQNIFMMLFALPLFANASGDNHPVSKVNEQVSKVVPVNKTCSVTASVTGGWHARCTNGSVYSGTITESCTITASTCEMAGSAATSCASTALQNGLPGAAAAAGKVACKTDHFEDAE